MTDLDINKFNITIKHNEKNNMLAQVELSYGELRIIGYRIMKSSYDGYYIQPPSVRGKGSWLWVARIDNPELWKDLQNKILIQYKESLKLIAEAESESVNPNELPF